MIAHVCFFEKRNERKYSNYLPLKQFAFFFSASYKIVKLDWSVSLVPSAMLLFMFTTWQGNV